MNTGPNKSSQCAEQSRCAFGVRTFCSTTLAVSDGLPSPALLTTMMRYSNSLPHGCSTSVASLVTTVAAPLQAPGSITAQFRLRPPGLSFGTHHRMHTSKVTQPADACGLCRSLPTFMPRPKPQTYSFGPLPQRTHHTTTAGTTEQTRIRHLHFQRTAK